MPKPPPNKGVSLTYGGDIVPKTYVKDEPGTLAAKGKAKKPFPMRKDKSGSGFLKAKR